MTKKRMFAAICGAALLLSLTACGGSSTAESSDAPETTTTTAPAETTAAPVANVEDTLPEFETPVEAQPGEAYLAAIDGQFWIQYMGKASDILSYDAGVVPITGNGDYTVSVTTDTNAFRYDYSQGDVNAETVVSGFSFLGVIIRDAESLMPDAIITVNSIKIDDKEVELTAKNYTSSEDGHIRSNLYNKFVSKPSGDARCVDGALYDEAGNAVLADADAYSPNVFDIDKIGNWGKIEVNFTVSGLDDTGSEGEATESEADAETSAAESAAE